MRNNAANPGMGQVIMFAAATGGWVILFLINLAMYTPTGGWWARAIFSGVLLLGSLVFSVLLWRRMVRGKADDRS